MNKKHFYAAVILLTFLAAGIQPALALISVPTQTTIDGIQIATWDPITKTYTLTANVSEGLVIVADNFTLDGNGQTIIPTTAEFTYGIFVSRKTGITIMNVNIEKNAGGLGFGKGINILESDNITLTSNTVSGCDAGEFSSGIYLNLTYDSNLTNNTVSNNSYGIRLYLSYSNLEPDQGNTLTNNTVLDNTYGIELFCSTYNTLTSNTTSGNGQGIRIWGAGNNNLTSNNASNNIIGIRLYDQATDNVLTNNTTSYNRDGINLNNSSNNTIYNNNFIANTNQAIVSGGSGNVFNLDNPTGGNYWDDWNGSGPYVIVPPDVVQDNLPWTCQDGWSAPVNQPPVADAGPDQNVEGACQQGGTKVTLDGTDSYDPDEDLLTYTWTGDFSETPTSGATPTVTLNGCQPSYVITLVVNDGELDSEQDTVTITVEDTIPPDITRPGDIEPEAQCPQGVPVEDEQIQAFLDGASADDDCDPSPLISNDAPTDFFPLGETLVTFTATDASGNTSTCCSTVTVVEAAEGHLRIIPPIINREGRLRKILAVISFPEGTAEEDIDMDVPLVLYPGDSPYGIEATHQRIVTWCRWGTLRVCMFGFFPKDDVTAAVPEDGPVEFMVFGRFMDGECFYGLDNVWIISWDWPWW